MMKLPCSLSPHTSQEIRKAYKKLALKYHPDRNPKTTPLFQAIQTANENLSDRIRRHHIVLSLHFMFS